MNLAHHGIHIEVTSVVINVAIDPGYAPAMVAGLTREGGEGGHDAN